MTAVTQADTGPAPADTPAQIGGSSGTGPDCGPGRAGRWKIRLFLQHPLLPIAVFILLAVTSMWRKSATYDEPLLLASGAHYLRTFDVSINAENPPLLKALYALPTLAVRKFGTDVPVPDKLPYSYEMPEEFSYGNAVLYSHPHHRLILFACRCMAVAAGTLLALVLFLAASRIWSRETALAVLWVYALSPNLLAHTRLISVDLGCAAAVFGSVLALHDLIRRPNRLRTVIFGGCLGIALLTKFTAVLLIPGLGLQTLAYAARHRSQSFWRLRTPHLAAAGVLALLLLNLAYGFRGCGLRLADRQYRSPLVSRLQEIPVLKQIPLPVPEEYLRGFDIVANNNRPGFPNIFLGKLYPRGGSWWYYYLTVIALKTPIPLLILLGISTAAVLSRQSRETQLTIVVIGIVPALLFFNFSVIAYRQLGLRYILPIWPFGILFCGFGIDLIRQVTGQHGRHLWKVVLLAAWYALGTLFCYPDFLGCFNAIAGGSHGGWRYLAASNIDWGQDLYELRRWIRKNGSPPISVLYCGSAPLEAHGIRPVPFGTLPPAPYLAISVTQYYLLQDVPLVAFLRDRTPLAYAGASIHIHAIDETVLGEFRRRAERALK